MVLSKNPLANHSSQSSMAMYNNEPSKITTFTDWTSILRKSLQSLLGCIKHCTGLKMCVSLKVEHVSGDIIIVLISSLKMFQNFLHLRRIRSSTTMNSVGGVLLTLEQYTQFVHVPCSKHVQWSVYCHVGNLLGAVVKARYFDPNKSQLVYW